MSKKKSGTGAGASLADLLAEHTQIAEREKQELEARLRKKEEEDRQRREEEERKQKEAIQQRLEEEKLRAEERFRRQKRRTDPEMAAVTEETQTQAAPVAAPAAAPEPARRGGVGVAVAATVVLMAGLAVGAYFLLFADKTPQLDVMGRQAAAVLAAADSRVTVLKEKHADAQHAAEQADNIAKLSRDLAALQQSVSQLTEEKQKAIAAAAEEARKRAEAEEAAAASSSRKPKRSGAKKKSGKLEVRDVFGRKGKLIE